MHKVLIDVVHYVVNNDIPYSFLFVVFDNLLLLYELLINFVMVLDLLIFVFEGKLENNGFWLRTVEDFNYYEDNGCSCDAEEPSSEGHVVNWGIDDESCYYFPNDFDDVAHNHMRAFEGKEWFADGVLEHFNPCEETHKKL